MLCYYLFVSDVLIDVDFIKRRIDELEEALKYIKKILKEDEENFVKDFKSRFTLRHLILVIVGSAASIAMHIEAGSEI